MLRIGLFRATTAVFLSFLLLIGSTPISAAELGTTALGSISVAGNVVVRDAAVTRETTLFAGDRIRTAEKSSAQATLTNGNKVGLISDSELLVSATDGNRSTLSAGTLSFTASKQPMAFTLADYEVRSSADSRGVVSFVDPNFIGIRAMSGTLTVVNTKTKKSDVVASGNDYFINLKTQQMNVPLEQLASLTPIVATAQGGAQNAPANAPPAAPQNPPANSSQGGKGNGPKSGGINAKWIAIIAAAGGVAVVAAVASGSESNP